LLFTSYLSIRNSFNLFLAQKTRGSKLPTHSPASPEFTSTSAQRRCQQRTPPSPCTPPSPPRRTPHPHAISASPEDHRRSPAAHARSRRGFSPASVSTRAQQHLSQSACDTCRYATVITVQNHVLDRFSLIFRLAISLDSYIQIHRLFFLCTHIDPENPLAAKFHTFALFKFEFV
jgi:hypothetical protein